MCCNSQNISLIRLHSNTTSDNTLKGGHQRNLLHPVKNKQTWNPFQWWWRLWYRSLLRVQPLHRVPFCCWQQLCITSDIAGLNNQQFHNVLCWESALQTWKKWRCFLLVFFARWDSCYQISWTAPLLGLLKLSQSDLFFSVWSPSKSILFWEDEQSVFHLSTPSYPRDFWTFLYRCDRCLGFVSHLNAAGLQRSTSFYL